MLQTEIILDKINCSLKACYVKYKQMVVDFSNIICIIQTMESRIPLWYGLEQEMILLT